jgi:hypothetical protein
MKKQVKLHEFNPTIYPRLLWISISKAKFEDRFENVSDFYNCCNAIVDCVFDKIQQRGGVLIRFADKKAMTVSTITHESIHAAINILNYCDINITVDNQEPLAYLAGFIASCCEEVKNDKHYATAKEEKE